MALTQSEIQRIHNSKLARFGQRYYSNDEKIYIGTKEGRLELVLKAEKTTLKEIETIASKEVQGGIKELTERIIKVEKDYITNIQLLKAKEEAKCFAVTMSIIF